MLLLHFWVRQCPVTDAMKDVEVDKHTAIDVFQWFREVCLSSLMQGPQIVLGGPGTVIHIDESLFRHKPKVTETVQYILFRTIVVVTLHKEVWVFGLVDTSTTPSLEIVQCRDAQTLLPIILLQAVAGIQLSAKFTSCGSSQHG